MLRKLICLAAFAAFTASSLIAVAQPASDVVPSAIVTEKNVAMKTRDGVTSSADIYRPAGDGPFYVLLVRTPYNKDGFAYFGPKGRQPRLHGRRPGRPRPLLVRRRVVPLQARDRRRLRRR
jgi:predicted acyl esterase